MMLVNTNQLMVAKAEYEPYGNFLSLSGPKAYVNPFWFSSKPIHWQSGKYDFLYRWYVPDLDRWLNQDPIQEEGGINLYDYAGNDPIDWVDPYGLYSLDELGQIAGAGAIGALQGLASVGDGLSPFGTPLADLGAYDPNDPDFALGAAAGMLAGLDDGATEAKLAGKGLKYCKAPKLGPSGKPMIHNPKYPTPKGAKDAARNAGKGPPIKHNDHYHATDANGNKIPGTHYGF
jgi:RHS repeat-associated protein